MTGQHIRSEEHIAKRIQLQEALLKDLMHLHNALHNDLLEKQKAVKSAKTVGERYELRQQLWGDQGMNDWFVALNQAFDATFRDTVIQSAKIDHETPPAIIIPERNPR